MQSTENQVEEKTISLYEKHKKIYVREVSGWWANWRWLFVLITQIFFFLTPWLMWNSRQAVLLHLVERKFYIFHLVFWPQDVVYLTVILIISAYSLFLFTAVAGRLFCGYACPQTVYTEIFLWIENKIEGDHNARRKLDQGPWTANKFIRKSAKFSIWGAIALWAGFTLVGWFTPIRPLVNEVLSGSIDGWGLFWIVFYASFFMLQAGFLREQVCKYMCPYARFQSVMFDKDTLIISYDQRRGEPRGMKKRNKSEQTIAANSELEQQNKLGDCIDCGICVQVCPTGIDIRKGLQYECIGCGACIDACDTVMEKTGSPKGLVRYTSEDALEKNYQHDSIWKHMVRPRILLYSAILWAIIFAFMWSLYIRIPMRMDVIRDRGVLMRELSDGRFENIYILKIMNMREQPHSFTINSHGLDKAELSITQPINISAMSNHEISLSVRAPVDGRKGAQTIYFDIADIQEPNIKRSEKSSFIFP